MAGQGNAGQNNRRSGSAKQNYTAIKYGNNQGSIAFGQIHKQGDVTSGVMLETPDGEHQLSLDLDGQRKGWTVSTSPGNFQVECGSAKKEAEDSMVLNAKNGNIILLATNGKIRMQATDIEMIAVGEGGAKGNIKMNATETITTESKKFLVNAKSFYRIASPQTGEVVANGVLKLYSSIIRGVTDAVAVKDSKVAGQRFQKQMNEGV
tara:strand:- start:163 stop:783 length:621 start_codon:yes stop_codon:yes gene_type:complete